MARPPGSVEGGIEVAVDRLSCADVAQFFAEADLRWPDGTEMRVDLTVRAGGGWVSEPVLRASGSPYPSALTGEVVRVHVN